MKTSKMIMITMVTITIMLSSINLFGQFSGNILYDMSIVPGTIFIDGKQGSIASDNDAMVSIHLNANQSYQLRISGDGTTFAFNGQMFTLYQSDIVTIKLKPFRDMDLEMSISTEKTKGKFTWVLLYSPELN